MNTVAELKQKQTRATKRHFGYESQDEPIEEETIFFNVLVAAVICSIEERVQ